MNYPVISVVMPVFNGERHLNDSIDSILNQTFKNFEFIILNDGSTDRTEEIILSYKDKRIVYIKNQKNLKLVHTLNKGIKLAKGDYIARMDADDISHPTRLEKQFNFMELSSEIGVCGAWVQTFGSKSELWKYPENSDEIKATLIFSSSLAHPSVMIRRTVFDQVCYDDEFYGAEDYALWVKLINKTEFYNLPEVLIQYRLHESKTHKKSQLKSANRLRLLMLRTIGCSLFDCELEVFFDLAMNRKVSIDKAEHVLIKIMEWNNLSRFFERHCFNEVLSKKLWQIYNTDFNYSLSLYFRYRNSILSCTNLPLISRFKFMAKCLVRYSNEK